MALITTSLAVEFTEPIEMASAPDAIELEPTVEGSVSWSGSTMIFTPREPLSLLTTYTVTIGEGIRDLAGNPMTDLPAPFTFETTGPPEVIETVPADGATDVALDGPIAVSFSTLMDTASVEASLRLRPAFPHELRWSGLLLEIVPDQPLETDREYEITVGEGAFDVCGRGARRARHPHLPHGVVGPAAVRAGTRGRDRRDRTHVTDRRHLRQGRGSGLADRRRAPDDHA